MALDQYGNWICDPQPLTPNLPNSFLNSISYAGPPLLTPPAIQAIVVDSNGRQWQYFNGAWN